MKRFILRNNGNRDSCKTHLDTLELDADKPMEVLIRPHRRNRSAAQQALMWIWHDQWSAHFGDSDKEEHIRFKAEYLLPVLIRDQVMEGLDELHNDATERIRLDGDYRPMNALYRMISTNWLNVKQMAEILTAYQQDTATLGLVFVTLCPEYEDVFPRRRAV